MNIVLEGPDNAGKSTLASHLSKALAMSIKHSGGPSKYPGEVNARADNFNLDKQSYIYDRHPCISQNIYVEALKTGGELVTPERIRAFYATRPLIIYCRSRGNLEGHEQSEHSSLEYFNQVERNYATLCKLYDKWGLVSAHLIYRIGDDTQHFINIVKGIVYEY